MKTALENTFSGAPKISLTFITNPRSREELEALIALSGSQTIPDYFM